MPDIILVKESIFMDFEEIQVVCMHEILSLTQQGWKLLCFVTDQEIKDGYMEAIPDGSSQNCPNCHNYYSQQLQQVHGSVVVNRPHAVLGKHKDEVVSGLREELDQTRGYAGGLEKEVQDISKKIEGLENVLEGHKADAERYQKYYEEEVEKNKRLRNLEKHLEKARKIVGERDWKKEVLGEDN